MPFTAHHSNPLRRILWPFAADQPANAAYLTDTLHAGYELIEVRTGPGLLPILRTGRKAVGTVDAIRAEAREVLAKAFGSDGADKRTNVEKLQHAILGEWDEGGAGKADAMAFLENL